MIKKYGYYNLSAFSPKIYLGNPQKNLEEIKKSIKKHKELTSILVFPELSLTGYTCEDYFLQNDLKIKIDAALENFLKFSLDYSNQTFILGTPLYHNGKIYNCALVIHNGKILGAIPKGFLPNYKEFYEERWFTSGRDVEFEMEYLGSKFLLSSKQNFQIDKLIFAVEICEDMWAPQSPMSDNIANGAHVVINLSASPELVGKDRKRRMLLKSFTEKMICSYLYCSSSWTESTKDLVFSGDKFLVENGNVMEESELYNHGDLLVQTDIEKLNNLRHQNKTWAQWSNGFSSIKHIMVGNSINPKKILKNYSKLPFVPADEEIENRTKEVMAIQKHALARRVLASKVESLILGFSGGLDSTWALLVIYETMKLLKWKPDQLKIYSLPGLGTGEQTRSNIKSLTKSLNLKYEEISIVKAVEQEMKDIMHDEDKQDVVFENIQARNRTLKLFNLANKHNGLVVGTGDLSEIALGWCTYNADHISSYNVNSSIPKTLVKYLVKGYGDINKKVNKSLLDILNTPISPELLKLENGKISQKTEDIIGPFELHDFFLYHKIKYGFSNEKILYLAKKVFSKEYSTKYVKEIFSIFLSRFKNNQFKRDCVPGGPKVGTVSLSPRGDWRMPSELDDF